MVDHVKDARSKMLFQKFQPAMISIWLRDGVVEFNKNKTFKLIAYSDTTNF